MNDQTKLSRTLGMIFGIMGLSFFLLGAGFLVWHYCFMNELALMINGFVFSQIGGIFLIVGICSLLIARRHRKKAERLMRDGICCEAEIVRIYEKSYTRINHRNPFVVECVYKDWRGTSYLVKSGNVWGNSFAVQESDIKARVWANPDNPKDYYVEVYTKESPDVKYDHDYR